MDIIELTTETEFQEAFPLMSELRSNLSLGEYMSYLKAMRQEGYRLFALKFEDEFLSLAGCSVLTNFYYGRHVWIFDLVTKQTDRSQGYGKRLLEYIEDWAKQHECGVVALSSGLERVDAHRFYEVKSKYEKPSYVFKKNLA